MGEVRYDSDNRDEFANVRREQSSSLDLTGWIVHMGAAPDRRVAEYILIGVAILAIAIGFFAWRISKPSAVAAPPANPFQTQGQPDSYAS